MKCPACGSQDIMVCANTYIRILGQDEEIEQCGGYEYNDNSPARCEKCFIERRLIEFCA